MINDVYTERNHLVALLSSLYPSGRAKTAIEGWDEAWHGCVYIDFPWGQASWHYHESEAYLFEHLPPYTKPWDGHTTEQKYTAIRDALKNPEPPWRHPKIQSLISQRARLSIQLSLVEQLLEDPYMDTTASDMEYWDTLHDDLYYKLTEHQPVAPVAWESCEHGDDKWHSISEDAYGANPDRYKYRELYTTPPRHEWQVLTDNDLSDAAKSVPAAIYTLMQGQSENLTAGQMRAALNTFALAIEAALKGKNCE